ncbi:hypothetical protein [Pseudomonas thivervalensis]|uniref:hypothetical protein n=1 Tax=Pseudomonas thivervalensis TaxID=86265 RepID=UPI000879A0B4|nr:hypothetical protein [Pseudomonas thivervalensis]SDG48138.1 hypothetical protein SAMN04490204_4445 [Pseudomonas thivervalensis]
MDTESSVLNHPFDLFPVYIPGWKTPVLPEGLAHGGIPQSIYDGRPQGLQCVIYAWTELKSGSWTMAVLDRVDLYVNGELSGAGFTVQPGEENKEYFLLDLPQGKLREGVNRLHYTITRLSENPGISDDLNVLYHLRAPGEPAPQGLDLVIPPDVLLDGVSAEQAAQGVTFGFTYSNPRDYDSIRFLVGNVTVPVDGFDASRPVTHTLFTDTFRQAGDNPNTALQFTVTDQLGNANRSSIKHLDIHLDRVLIAPTLTHVKDSAGQEIPDKGETTSTTLELSGEASKGKEIEVYDGSGASAVPKGKALADATTGLWTREISVSVGARRLYAKSLYHPTNVYSNVRTLTVSQLLNLIEPSVKEANGAILNPISAKDLLTVVVPANAALLPGDKLKVTWTGAPGTSVEGSHTSGESLVSAGLEIRIPNSVVAFNLGKSVKVSYEVTRGNEPPIPSPVFDLAVLPLTQADLLMAKPMILQAANNGEGPELDLASFSGEATLKVTPWPLIALDQKVWLRCDGTTADGFPHTIIVQAASGVTVNEVGAGLLKPVPWGQLQLLRDRSELNVVLLVTFDKAPDIATAIEFPLRTYTVKPVVLETPLITSVKDPSNTLISEGGYTLATTVTLTGQATPNTKVEIFDGTEKKNTVEVDSKGLWEDTLSGLDIGSHSFTARAIMRNNPVSPPWRFTVVARLAIDQAVHFLVGLHVRTAAIPPNPPPNTYVDRVPSGGLAPYFYMSSDSTVAEVATQTQPRVLSRGEGNATITVHDSSGQSTSYRVTVANVWLVSRVALGRGAFLECWNQAQAEGGTIPTLEAWGKLLLAYNGNAGFGGDRAWTADISGTGQRWAVIPIEYSHKISVYEYDHASALKAVKV